MQPVEVTAPNRKLSARPAAGTVADLLSDHINAGLTVGDQLPSEAELATRFDVSRVTVREALKILAGRGLVALSRGKKAVVTRPDGAMFGAFLQSLLRSDPRSMFDLVQVRRSLEIQAVTFACRNASRSGLAAIEGALTAMAEWAAAMPDSDWDPDVELAFNLADVQFHQAVALAGGNRVLTFLFEAMETSLLETFTVSHRGGRYTAASLQVTLDAHRQIFEHIRIRDERAAADAMMNLLARSEANLNAAFGKP